MQNAIFDKEQHANAIDDEKTQEQQPQQPQQPTYAKDVSVILEDTQYIVPSDAPLADGQQQQPSPAQLQQQQQSQQPQQQSQSITQQQQQQTSQGMKLAGSGSGSATGNSGIPSSNDAAYQETSYLNSSTNEAFTLQQSQDDKDLETRLK